MKISVRQPEKHRRADDMEAEGQSEEAVYRTWRTWQMSDHRPLWIEIATDYADHYLETFGDPE